MKALLMSSLVICAIGTVAAAPAPTTVSTQKEPDTNIQSMVNNFNSLNKNREVTIIGRFEKYESGGILSSPELYLTGKNGTKVEIDLPSGASYYSTKGDLIQIKAQQADLSKDGKSINIDWESKNPVRTYSKFQGIYEVPSILNITQAEAFSKTVKAESPDAPLTTGYHLFKDALVVNKQVNSQGNIVLTLKVQDPQGQVWTTYIMVNKSSTLKAKDQLYLEGYVQSINSTSHTFDFNPLVIDISNYQYTQYDHWENYSYKNNS